MLILLLLLFSSCSLRNSTQARIENTIVKNEWNIIGPGAGGGVFIPTISPFDTNLVFSKGDMTGNFVTYDGGKSWKLFNLMSVTQDFEFDPVDSDVVYAASRGYLYDEDRGSGLTMLYRSENRGKTWKVIFPDIDKIAPLEKLQSMAFLPSQLVKDMPDGSIDKISIDPHDNKRIYIGLSPLRPYIGKIPGNTPLVTYIMVTENTGKDWRIIGKVPGTTVLGIFPDSMNNDGDIITVITDQTCGLINRKTEEIKKLSPPEGKFIVAAGGTISGKTTLYLVSEVERDENGVIKGGAYRSIDGGVNWVSINSELLKDLPKSSSASIRTVSVCESHPEVVYLSLVTSPKMGPDININVRYEIYKSLNSGETWNKVYSANSNEVLTHNFNDSWLNRNYGPGWGGDILTMGVAPGNPDICYATDYGQAYKTSNGGRTWNQVCSRNNPNGSVTSRGLDLTCCYGIVFDPFDKNHQVVSYIDIGLFHSFDGGKSWQQFIKGIPSDWVNTCYHITFDPAVKGKVWSTWANQHSLPRKSQFGDGLFEKPVGGVAYSEDAGKSWQKYSTGLPDHSICTDLLLDTSSRENARILYVTIFNQGVYKSTDNGKTWVNSSKGLKDNRYAWEIRQNGKRIYLLCVRGWRGENSVDGVLYYSDDKAETWNKAKLPEGVTAPSDLLIDPDNPRKMFMSCWPKHQNDKDICGGLFVTEDRGGTWDQCFDERIRVFAGAFDLHNTNSLFINTFQNGAYRSDDSGKTWTRILGYRFKWGHSPIPDPTDPSKLFLTTYGVSIYHGPSMGTPEEFGKIENIPDSWW
jgi:photosystem II stability/assembly factor-like uncharacterized protein